MCIQQENSDVDNNESPAQSLFLMHFNTLINLCFQIDILFLEGVAEVSGIMVGKYPETPGKLSTLSTMLYKQIVHKLLSLGKGEVDKL